MKRNNVSIEDAAPGFRTEKLVMLGVAGFIAGAVWLGLRGSEPAAVAQAQAKPTPPAPIYESEARKPRIRVEMGNGPAGPGQDAIGFDPGWQLLRDAQRSTSVRTLRQFVTERFLESMGDTWPLLERLDVDSAVVFQRGSLSMRLKAELNALEGTERDGTAVEVRLKQLQGRWFVDHLRLVPPPLEEDEGGA